MLSIWEWRIFHHVVRLQGYPGKECYKLLVSTVTPRPIAWVVSQDAKGVLNAGAFSFFNAFSGDPPVVAIGMGSHKPDGPKILARTFSKPASSS